MITLKHPALVRELTQYPGGLFPAQVLGGQPGVLVIKCPKEMILAAKMLHQIKFYPISLDADEVNTLGIVTAFFDDFDEPLVIRTPLVDDEMGNGLIALLCTPTFDIHFFDELDRELLGFKVDNRTAETFSCNREQIQLASRTYVPSSKIDDQMSDTFSHRNSEDDENALVVEFQEELFPSDFVIWDARPEANSYRGRKHDMFTSLERGDSGLFSELDIVKFLHRIFSSDEIFLNPHRTDDGKEFVDVMVVTDNNLLLIQAKDSPNTEETLCRPIERKISTALRHMKKATAQLRGSLSYVSSNEPFTVKCGDDIHSIAAEKLNVVSLVILRELFPTEYESYSQLALEVFHDTGIPCLIQDYSQFHQLTYHRRTEESFFGTLNQMMRFALIHNEYPRFRFWYLSGMS